jgi:squalene-hopene/tetraprenyl-beta-curcumene cyclase
MIFKWTRIDRSAELFDPSCPDIVGHVLEGMGECGIIDKEVIGESVKYLLEGRKNHMWTARWGINYIYGIGAVLPGLARIGYDMNQEWIINATTTLQTLQQEDGGFGEDSESYNTGSYLKGVTTVSMTAWGLLAYLEVAHLDIPNV